MKSKAQLLNEIRYGERLSERTARLYRHLQACGTFAAVVGGSGVLSSLSNKVDPAVAICGALLFVGFGALLIAVSPANKAASHEAERKRYAKLRSDAMSMADDELQQAIYRVRESDLQEVEPLRNVAQNDVLIEIGCPEQAAPLTRTERLYAALA